MTDSEYLERRERIRGYGALLTEEEREDMRNQLDEQYDEEQDEGD